MKIFVIVEKGYEYNDEYYSEHGLAGVTEAYKSEEKAQAECFRLNKARKQDGIADDRDRPITDFYDVLALDVADDEVEAATPASGKPVDVYQASREAVKKARERAAEIAKEAFATAAKELFARHENLECFSFVAYTDYFNDGDACSYNVHCDEPDINGESGDEIGRSHPLYGLQREVAKFIALFDDEDVMAMFDDHVRVIVERPGVVTKEDYDDHN